MYSREDNIILLTDRLEIIPLNAHELELITDDVKQFEKELNCEYRGEEMEGIILKIFKGQIDAVKKSGEQYYWNTFWLFRIKDNEFIGSACFKGAPNEKGQVELGYGINKQYQNYGYTTEAVKEMCKWALKQSDVNEVIAETEKQNIASQKVLIKCNMIKYKETEDCYWWKLTK